MESALLIADEMTMDERKITPDLLVAEIMQTWPETVPIFLGYRMICVGCFMSHFDTLEESLKIYNLPVQPILDDLNQLIRKDEENIQEHDHE